MHIDHFFTIGSAHQSQGTPCEDYALSGTLDNGAVFGIVADGCSGAQAHTDVGARAIAWAFKHGLERCFVAGNLDETFIQILQNTFASYQNQGSRDDYLATIVGFVATPTLASVYVHGDGAVAIQYADGRFGLIEFTWLDNMPFYLNYHYHAELLAQFMALYQDGIIEPFSKKTTIFRMVSGTLEILSVTVERFIFDDVFNGHFLKFFPEDDGIVALAVLTDGIEQVGATSPIEVIHEFLAFKNYQGQFVKRRTMKALKEFQKLAAIPRDDVGIAAVWFATENS